MNAIKDLFASERGFFAVLLVVGASVLTGIGRMPVEQWQDFSMWVFGIYVGGKSLTSAVGLISSKPSTTVEAAPPAEPKPETKTEAKTDA